MNDECSLMRRRVHVVEELVRTAAEGLPESASGLKPGMVGMLEGEIQALEKLPKIASGDPEQS